MFNSTIKIDTKLEYGEVSDLILHSIFEILVNYVEVELAGWYLCTHPEEKSNLSIKNRIKYLFNKPIRDSNLGIKHLEWESTLVYDENLTDDPELLGTPTSQAIAAKKAKELYYWWKLRKVRADSMDVTGYTPFIYTMMKKYNAEDSLFSDYRSKMTEEEKQEEDFLFKDYESLEEQYNEEDFNNSVELIHISKSLWT